MEPELTAAENAAVNNTEGSDPEFFLAHADRGRAQDDVGLMGETDLRSGVQKGTVN